MLWVVVPTAGDAVVFVGEVDGGGLDVGGPLDRKPGVFGTLEEWLTERRLVEWTQDTPFSAGMPGQAQAIASAA